MNAYLRQSLVSAEGWRWFTEPLMQVLVIARGPLMDKHGVDKTWQTHSNSGLLLIFTMLTAERLTIWRV